MTRLPRVNSPVSPPQTMATIILISNLFIARRFRVLKQHGCIGMDQGVDWQPLVKAGRRVLNRARLSGSVLLAYRRGLREGLSLGRKVGNRGRRWVVSLCVQRV